MASSLQTLKRRKKWPEALALASQTAPQEVPYLLEQAGNTFIKLSQSEKLYSLLETLPKEIKEDSYVLFWRFRIARRLGNHEALLKEVKQALSKDICAELRAFYYTHFDSKEKQLIETKKAMHAKPNFFTKHHYGLAITYVDAEAGHLFFKDFIAEVRQSREAYWLIQILDIWSFALRKTGRLTQALNCIKEALQLHKNELQSDWVSELHLRNNLIYASIELGKIEGLEDIVYEAEQDIDDIYEQLAFDLRATLGDYYFVTGQLDKAFIYFEKNYHTEQQRHSEVSAETLFNYVKIHLAKKQKEAAEKITKQALKKTNLRPENQLNSVAYALTVIQTKPKEALQTLLTLELKQLPDLLQLSARALLAYAYLKQGDRVSASQVLKEQTLGELSRQSFKLATVYEELAFIYDFWKGSDLLPIIRNPKAFDDLAKNQDD